VAREEVHCQSRGARSGFRSSFAAAMILFAGQYVLTAHEKSVVPAGSAFKIYLPGWFDARVASIRTAALSLSSNENC
jgi:hypothetical protein